jgi:hypothetical protein
MVALSCFKPIPLKLIVAIPIKMCARVQYSFYALLEWSLFLWFPKLRCVLYHHNQNGCHDEQMHLIVTSTHLR